MSDVKITVGGAMEDEAARRFVDAWHRAERGDSFHERHLAFESWDALARVLTGKRMELLRYVRLPVRTRQTDGIATLRPPAQRCQRPRPGEGAEPRLQQCACGCPSLDGRGASRHRQRRRACGL